MESKRLDNAALAAGISPNYINAHGKPQSIGADTKRRLLDAMNHGVATSVAATPVPNVMVWTYGKKMALPVDGKGEFSWILTTEEGKQHQGQVAGGKSLSLPTRLSEGYHSLTLTQNDERWHCRVIIAPERCYEPQPLKEAKKLWGACVQLYTLRSEKNWGIGDFGDLKVMLPEVAKRGGAFIGLNPIHALYPANPESASPYSPSSRRWMNVIYIDVNAVDDFAKSEEAQAWWKQPATQQKLKAARDVAQVDYTAVTELKMTALRLAWKRFAKRNDELMTAFRYFVDKEGESLYWQAAFDALQCSSGERRSDALGLASLAEGRIRRLKARKLRPFAKNMSMKWISTSGYSGWRIPNLPTAGKPVSATICRLASTAIWRWAWRKGGAETWCDRELYCLKASVGAPPDILGPLGQNWGLPPMDPHIIAARAYEPFIELLRANMKNCGALRIDHVMSVLRLWWIPYGETADHGAYVQYPVDALLSILALESKRHNCMVIGEDLGTVPVEIVSKLRKKRRLLVQSALF
ncbi:4-alpha-glucanotransferase [Kluyvera intermedia]|nr:4-alpha-glucanotransferase [Kluyvera intermedia]